MLPVCSFHSIFFSSQVDLDSSPSWYKTVFNSEPSLDKLTEQGWQITQEVRSRGTKQSDYYYYSPHTSIRLRSLRMAKVFYRIVEHFGCSEDDAYRLFKENEISFPKQKWEHSCTYKSKLSERSKVKCLACKEESKTRSRVIPAVKLESDLSLNPRLNRGKRQREEKDSDREAKQVGTAKHWSRGKEADLENSDIQHSRKKQRLEKKGGKASKGKGKQEDKAKRQPRRTEEDLENSNIHQDRKKHWLEEGVTVKERKGTKPSIDEGGRKKIWKIPTFRMIIQSIGLGKQSEGAAKQGDEAKHLSSREEEDLKNPIVQHDHKRHQYVAMRVIVKRRKVMKPSVGQGEKNQP